MNDGDWLTFERSQSVSLIILCVEVFIICRGTPSSSGVLVEINRALVIWIILLDLYEFRFMPHATKLNRKK